jgi:hypothetical protein
MDGKERSEGFEITITREINQSPLSGRFRKCGIDGKRLVVETRSGVVMTQGTIRVAEFMKKARVSRVE